jgi:hypothetical protein
MAARHPLDARRGVITATLTAETGNLDPVLKLVDIDPTELAENDNSTDGDAHRGVYDTGCRNVLPAKDQRRTGRTVERHLPLQLTGRAGIVEAGAGNHLRATVSG